MNKKLAIKINNKHEFDLLMNHYDSKGWKANNGERPIEMKRFDCKYTFQVQYNDKFFFDNSNTLEKNGFEIISFSNFANLMGIKAVKITIELSRDLTASITKEGVCFRNGNIELSINGSHLSEIYTAFQSF